MKLARPRPNGNPDPLPLWQWADTQELLSPNSSVVRIIRRKHHLPLLRARLVADLVGLGVRHD